MMRRLLFVLAIAFCTMADAQEHAADGGEVSPTAQRHVRIIHVLNSSLASVGIESLGEPYSVRASQAPGEANEHGISIEASGHRNATIVLAEAALPFGGRVVDRHHIGGTFSIDFNGVPRPPGTWLLIDCIVAAPAVEREPWQRDFLFAADAASAGGYSRLRPGVRAAPEPGGSSVYRTYGLLPPTSRSTSSISVHGYTSGWRLGGCDFIPVTASAN